MEEEIEDGGLEVKGKETVVKYLGKKEWIKWRKEGGSIKKIRSEIKESRINPYSKYLKNT